MRSGWRLWKHTRLCTPSGAGALTACKAPGELLATCLCCTDGGYCRSSWPPVSQLPELPRHLYFCLLLPVFSVVVSSHIFQVILATFRNRQTLLPGGRKPCAHMSSSVSRFRHGPSKAWQLATQGVGLTQLCPQDLAGLSNSFSLAGEGTQNKINVNARCL